jgi:hypothetical protein
MLICGDINQEVIREVFEDPKRFGMELGIEVEDDCEIETLSNLVKTEEMRRFVRENNSNDFDSSLSDLVGKAEELRNEGKIEESKNLIRNLHMIKRQASFIL